MIENILPVTSQCGGSRGANVSPAPLLRADLTPNNRVSYLEQARQALRGLHRCEVQHIETVHVCEDRVGSWDGDVEVFQLQGFPLADRSYAWGYRNDKRNGELDFISVPETSMITTPSAAVLAVLTWEKRVRQSTVSRGENGPRIHRERSCARRLGVERVVPNAL